MPPDSYYHATWLVLSNQFKRGTRDCSLYSGLRVYKIIVVNLAVGLAFITQGAPTETSAKQGGHPPKVSGVLRSITAADLKGDLSFLASDALGGRFSPSPGLAVAAEFIASRFRAAGLEPGGNQDYFQTAAMVDRQPAKPATPMTIKTASTTIEIPPQSWAILRASAATNIDHTQAVVFTALDDSGLSKSDVSGKAVIDLEPDFARLPQDQALAEYAKMQAFSKALSSKGAMVEIRVVQSQHLRTRPELLSVDEARKPVVPVVVTNSPELMQALRKPNASTQIQSATLTIPAPEDRPADLKNVVGILRGSDPRLKDTCVLLTAHYDHIGNRETGQGMAMPAKPSEANDHIYNGANDDGSGTVSVVEIAAALARLRPRPRRSIVFMTFFGEERGDIGSTYYGEHPVFPIADTVADLNLEQVGRTDSTSGKQINTASLTGYDYSNVTGFLQAAGRLTGIRVYKDAEASDAYFTRSDNAALAEQGVPAHSLTVAFDFPDYHGLGDEWQKIDYDNMARVDRMIALSILNMANSPRVPVWNAANPKTAPFREAQQKSRSK